MKKITLMLILTGFLLINPAFAEDNAFHIRGSYKNLFTSTNSVFTKEGLYVDTQRLRLEFEKHSGPWQFYLTLDNEALIHDAGNLGDFSIVRSRSQNNVASWDLDKTSVDNDHLFLRHSIYRAYVKYYTEKFQASLGKQSIDWGKMRFYSPIDFFNPVGPIDLERDQREGVDAINVNYAFQEFAGLNVVVVPHNEPDRTSAAMRVYKTIGTYDYAFVVGGIKEDTVVGFAFDGYIKSAGFRGELTQTWQERDNRSFTRASVGVDYNFNEKFYALLEHFYNGGNEDNDPSALISSLTTAHRIRSLKSNLTSLWVQYHLMPLVDLNQYIIYDWQGNSVVINPELIYNISQNINLTFGIQNFWGNTDSEFGDNEHLYYAQIKWFF